jgi:protein-disulfide isomerase
MRTAAIGGNRELTQAIIALKARLRNGRVSSCRSRQRHRPWDSTPMASRKEQKEAARQRRLAEEAAAQQKAQRNRRMQMLGGVIVAAIIVVVVLVVVSSGSGGKSSTAAIKPQSSKARSIAATVNNSLAGIPQSGTTLGNPKAKVTVTEFGDLECPICRDFALGAETQLIANQVKQGTVKIVYKSFKTATNDLADSDTIFPLQQSAAYAAGAQDKAWNYILLFYRRQQTENTPYVTTAFLTDLARAIPGLNVTKWSSDRFNPSYAQQVISENATASTMPFQGGQQPGTPALIASSGTKQTEAVSGDLSYSDVEKLIKQVS